MNREEAARILSQELAVYRKRSYRELLYLLDTQDTKEIVGASGARYQLEFQAVLDDPKKGHLRVMGSIDDGGARAFVPLTDGFIVSRDGTFVDE